MREGLEGGPDGHPNVVGRLVLVAVNAVLFTDKHVASETSLATLQLLEA